MLVENNPYPQDGRVRREATSLATAGYEVTVIAPSAGDQPRSDVVDGVRVHRYPAPPQANGLTGYIIEYGYSMVAAFALSLYVFARRGFDVVHTHNPPDTYVAIAAVYRVLGCKFVFDHHDLSPDLYLARFGSSARPSVHRVLAALQHGALNAAHRVIATNESYARVAIQDCGVPPDRVTVVRNGPDLQRVRLLQEDQCLRSRAPIILGYVGAMNHQDGLDYLLRSLAILSSYRSDFCCALIGDGDALDDLRRMARELDIDRHVWFAGHRGGDDLMRLLSTADVCVDPDPSNSYNDRSTMIKITEYMALGKPIVAFDLPEHRVTAGDAAVYASPNDEHHFARHLDELMDDPARRQVMGEIGRRRIDAQFSWHKQSQKLLDCYEDLLSS